MVRYIHRGLSSGRASVWLGWTGWTWIFRTVGGDDISSGFPSEMLNLQDLAHGQVIPSLLGDTFDSNKLAARVRLGSGGWVWNPKRADVWNVDGQPMSLDAQLDWTITGIVGNELDLSKFCGGVPGTLPTLTPQIGSSGKNEIWIAILHVPAFAMQGIQPLPIPAGQPAPHFGLYYNLMMGVTHGCRPRRPSPPIPIPLPVPIPPHRSNVAKWMQPLHPLKVQVGSDKSRKSIPFIVTAQDCLSSSYFYGWY